MTYSPGPHGPPPFSTSSPEEQATSGRGQSPIVSGAPQPLSSQRHPRTQYEFIMQTGDETSTGMKEKLRTVRSHVMKNYLHQQQRRHNSKCSLQPSNSKERRKSNSCTRRRRSMSFDTHPNPTKSVSPGVAPSIAVPVSRFTILSAFLDIELGQVENSVQPTLPKFSASTSHDEVSRIARQYIECVFADKRIRSPEPTYGTLTLKGEIVRAVKDTLAICGGEISQSVIFAVSLLIYGCAMAEEWIEAQSHAEALRCLVELCGGIETVDFELQRTVTWTTYCLAAALGAPPTFSPPLFLQSDAFSLAFFDEAQIRAWRTVKKFPKNSPFVYDVVIRLHRLGLATSMEWFRNIDHRGLSNLYFEAMFIALSVSIEEPWNATLRNSTQGQELSAMFRLWAATLPLFVWATTRQVNSRFRVTVPWSGNNLVVSRIHGLLEGSGSFSTWPRGKYLEPVLISLFYCVEACSHDDPWRLWAISTLRKVIDMLKIKRHDEFRKTLDIFPITKEYQLAADVLWKDIVHGGNNSYRG